MFKLSFFVVLFFLTACVSVSEGVDPGRRLDFPEVERDPDDNFLDALP